MIESWMAGHGVTTWAVRTTLPIYSSLWMAASRHLARHNELKVTVQKCSIIMIYCSQRRGDGYNEIGDRISQNCFIGKLALCNWTAKAVKWPSHTLFSDRYFVDISWSILLRTNFDNEFTYLQQASLMNLSAGWIPSSGSTHRTSQLCALRYHQGCKKININTIFA